MAYAVAAIVKKDGKPYVDMAAVNAAPAGTFFWVGLATNCPTSDLLPLCDSLCFGRQCLKNYAVQLELLKFGEARLCWSLHKMLQPI